MYETQTAPAKVNESKTLKALSRPSRFQDPMLSKPVLNVSLVIMV